MRQKSKVDEKIERATSVSIVTDGYTNIRGVSVVNYIACLPEPYFLKSVATGLNKHTKEYLAQQLSLVIDEVGENKVHGVVSDNASNIQGTFKLLQHVKYHSVVRIGCYAHGINLLIKDILKLSWSKNFVSTSVEISKFFKSYHVVGEILRLKQKEEHLKTVAFCIPGVTR